MNPIHSAVNWIRHKADNIYEWYARNGYRRIYASLSGSSGVGGGISPYPGPESIALTISTVYACSRIIAEDVGSLPLLLYENTSAGRWAADKSYPSLYEILHDLPNPESTALEVREAITHHTVLWGNGYLRLVRRRSDNKLIAAYILLPHETRPDRARNGNLVYINKEGGAAEKTYQMGEIFHLRNISYDGIIGYSTVALARRSMELAASAEAYGNKFYKSGGRPSGILTHPKVLGPQAHQKIKERYDESVRSESGILVLEEDIKYTATTIPPNDAQFLETRQFMVPEICRWFRMPPHKVADLSRATFSNIAQQQLEYYTNCLRPWLERWEAAIYRCMLTVEERKNFFAEHIIEGLLRGDFEQQMKGFALGLQNGIYSINEVRGYQNLNSVEGGDDHRVQMQMVDILNPAAGDPGAVAAAQQKHFERVKGVVWELR